MNQYEVNFIIDPVLSGDEIKTTAKTYESLLKDEGCNIVHINEMGLKQLSYPINKRTSGIYYCVEFTTLTGAIIPKLELALRRDERIMRFLSVKLDKYAVQYNADRRAGKITSYKKKDKKKSSEDEAAAAKEAAAKDVAAKEVAAKEVAAKEVAAKEAAAKEVAAKEAAAAAVIAETPVTAPEPEIVPVVAANEEE